MKIGWTTYIGDHMTEGNGYIQTAGEADFATKVIQRSHEVPVVVDFWAEWCAPCRALGPVLERLALQAGGDWLLVKVDVDENPSLAASFGVRGIPAVRAFKDGREVGEFTGALPEDQVRQWLSRLGPSKADLVVQEALGAEERGDLAAAAEAFRRALTDDSSHREAAAGLARCQLRLRVEKLDRDELEQRLAGNGADLEAAVGLADLDLVSGDPERAFQRLVDLVREAEGEERDRARQHLLQLLDSLPADDPRVLFARRSLAAALY